MIMQTPIIAYDNRLNDIGAVLSATSTASGFYVANLKDLRPYTYWKSAITTVQYYTVDCLSAKSANCLSILGHNFATIGATISLECSSDNFGVVIEVALPGFIPSSDKAILKTFTSQNYRYWRLKMTGMTAVPQMAILMIGTKLQFPYPPEAPAPPYAEGIEGRMAKSQKGHPLGAAILFHPLELRASFINLTRTFAFDTYKPFWDAHGKKLKPFFYAGDIDAYPDYVFFVRMKEGVLFNPGLTVGNLVDSIGLDMEGVSEF